MKERCMLMKNDFSTQIPVKQNQYVERRRKKDWVVRCVSLTAVIGWLFALVALIYANRAKPAYVGYLTRVFRVDVVQYWDVAMLNMSFRALLISFVTCLIGLLFNMTRKRRKSDRFNVAIISLGVISLIAIVIFYAFNHDVIYF